ncbi:MAG: flagellar hook-basal body complex protein [Edaphobacter sp.]
MGNFSIALSGLEADTVALNTIGNNLSNLNTTAYKGQTTSFEDLFYQQIGQSGSGDPLQVGAGTKVSGTSTDFSEGTILPDTNTNSSDMALDGNGFFLVSQNGQQSLTRSGNFQVANNGSLMTQDGASVLGYPVVNETAEATQNFSVTANLSSGAALGSTVSSPVQVYDSLGHSHVATVTYTNAGPNSWTYSVSLPAADSSAPPVTGTLTFSAAGVPTLSQSNIGFSGLSDGAANLNMTWNANGLSNTTAASLNITSAQDGNPAMNGVVNVNVNPQAITLPVGSTQGAQSTQNISATVNLNSNAPMGTSFTTPVQIFDSLGQSHQATITYDKTGTNTWSYSVSLPAGDASGTPVNNTGTLAFDSNGNLTSPTGVVSGITFPGLADGASDLTFNWNLNGSGSTPTITQLASANTNGPVNQDGFPSGNYTGFTVDPSGVIQAQFSNGNKQTIGQVAVATVANEQGLVAIGGNNFATTAASGQAVAGVAGTGGRGTVDDGALEQSNVDISTEFSDLIVAQRAFEANSKTVTTFDTISQDVIGMIR